MSDKTPTKQQPVAPQDKESASVRFTQMVMAEYGKTGTYKPTEREKQLIRNYFIAIDQTLKKAEADRVRKNESNKDHKYDNTLPYSWNTINLPALAQDLAHYARIGLDMLEDATLYPIPYKDNKAQKYTITLMEGYNGIKFQAVKYALEPFEDVTVEVIYSNDKFRAIKKDSRNAVEGYEFQIPTPFDRGEPIGAFGYIQYADQKKNKLVIFSMADIKKRKPKYASAEFWGGEKTVYENGKQVKTQLEGWLPEMIEKTMKREIYGCKHIPRDPNKVDESYRYVQQREAQYADMVIEAEVYDNGNAEPLELPPVELDAPSEQPEDEPTAPLPLTDEEDPEAGF